jgi:hypothetical protein|tara:strand:+ start:75 stop:779 length:705 start_codon:yes stop_codon:yes gene_type:complete
MEVYIGVGILLFFLTFLAYAIVQGQLRAKAMKQLAESLNFSVVPLDGDEEETFIQSLSRLPLFTRGSQRGVWNVIKGTMHDTPITILDYRYSYRNSNSRPCLQTVLLFEWPGLNLPVFSLRAQTQRDKPGQDFLLSIMPMAQSLMPHTIDMSEHQEFAQRFWLQGTQKNEQTVRKLFNDDVVHFFERHNNLSTDAAGTKIAVYHMKKEISPRNMQAAIDRGLDICRLLQNVHHD